MAFIKLNLHNDMIMKNVRVAELNTIFMSAALNTQIFKDYFILYECLFCDRNYQKNFDEILKKRFVNIYFHSNNINKFKLMLQKSVSKYEYIFVFENFKVSNSGNYHDLYDQINTLLLADVFENFQNMCLEIYGLESACFLTTQRLAWQAAFRKA